MIYLHSIISNDYHFVENSIMKSRRHDGIYVKGQTSDLSEKVNRYDAPLE